MKEERQLAYSSAKFKKKRKKRNTIKGQIRGSNFCCGNFIKVDLIAAALIIISAFQF